MHLPDCFVLLYTERAASLYKNAGKAHVRASRCIKQRHMGWCKICFDISAVKYGCDSCDVKGDGILNHDPKLENRGRDTHQREKHIQKDGVLDEKQTH